MPIVIAISILIYNIREDNKDVLQPFKIMYTKPPKRKAIPQFGGYNIQLPRLLEMEPDFSSGLYCWFYTIYTAHKENKTISEVMDMIPQLQEYAKEDSGFMQFCEQYELAAADPKTRREYFIWYNDRWREAGMLYAAREEGMLLGRDEGMQLGREEGMQLGREEGIQRGVLQIARNLKNDGISIENIARLTNLSVSQIDRL